MLQESLKSKEDSQLFDGIDLKREIKKADTIERVFSHFLKESITSSNFQLTLFLLAMIEHELSAEDVKLAKKYKKTIINSNAFIYWLLKTCQCDPNLIDQAGNSALFYAKSSGTVREDIILAMEYSSQSSCLIC
jgi:hypothetical protein